MTRRMAALNATATRTQTTVKITNLPSAAAEREFLYGNFLPFGEIVDVEVLPARSGDKSGIDRSARGRGGRGGHGGRGAHAGRAGRDEGRTAYVEYTDPSDAAAAIDNMDMGEFFATTIHCTAAEAVRPAELAFEGLGSKVPLWEQEGFVRQYMTNRDGEEAQDGVDDDGPRHKRPRTDANEGEHPMAALEQAKRAALAAPGSTKDDQDSDG